MVHQAVLLLAEFSAHSFSSMRGVTAEYALHSHYGAVTYLVQQA